MKLSRIYSNKSKEFGPIEFGTGLNAVLAEIRLPENRGKDTHNLGKSTLARLLKFCLLAGRRPDQFLFKHIDLFGSFVFYLELRLDETKFVTIRRSVETSSRVSFKKHSASGQDYSGLKENEWDHPDLAFEKSKTLLEGLLALKALKPWSFRDSAGYQLRSQDDYGDVFRLSKNRGKHKYWKPFLAHILGFDSLKVQEYDEVEGDLEREEGKEKTVELELGGSIEEMTKVEGILLLKSAEADKRQAVLDGLNFNPQDREHCELLVEDVDVRIADQNQSRYSLRHRQKKIESSLEVNKIQFRTSEAKRIFDDAGVLFDGQIQKDFDQLVAFNNAITVERQEYLRIELVELRDELAAIDIDLQILGEKRTQSLAFLSSTDIWDKYRAEANRLVNLKAEILALKEKQKMLRRLKDIRKEIRNLKTKRDALQQQIETDTEEKYANKDSRFSEIRLYFSEIVEHVIERKALLDVVVNSKGHLDFSAEILDQKGESTSAGLGHTYRKLLCIAFDMAVLRSHSTESFPRFVYHDGVFEALDDRKKEKLLQIIREYSNYGLQQVVTSIDSDLPTSARGRVFTKNEIVLTLHDQDQSGRLFRIQSW